MTVPHEEGWSEVWQLLSRWLGGNGDHANSEGGWDDVHPASPTRQLALLQLHGKSDYVPKGAQAPRRGVSVNAPCRICFQPQKDVMVPGFPGIMDYPSSHGLATCAHRHRQPFVLAMRNAGCPWQCVGDRLHT
eukprot:6204150-Pleurochrysis_carterae.AAC.1